MTMPEESGAPVAAPVSDHRPVPRGVLPRRFQTWLMAGLAVGIVLIILITGQREPSRNPTQLQPAPVAPNPDRLRDYQERLRAMEARQALEGQPAQPAAPEVPRFEEPASPAPEDPIAADRKRREYESLFASNVVLSRRPEGERPEAARVAGSAPGETPRDNSTPSLDEIAEAVLRATGGASAGAVRSASPTASGTTAQIAPAPATGDRRERTPERTDPINAAGPLHRLLEGTVIDTGTDQQTRRRWNSPRQLPGDQPCVLPQRAPRADSRGGTCARRDATSSGAWRDAARRGLSPAPDAGRQHAASRSVSGPQSDRRRGPAGQSQPTLLVHVRRCRCGGSYQRLGAVDRHCWLVGWNG